MSKKLLLVLLALSLAAGLAFAQKRALGSEENPIVWAFVPSGEMERVSAGAQQVADLLHDKTGYYFKTLVATEYAGVIEALRASPPSAHMTSLATFAYIMAADMGVSRAALVSVRNKSPFYKGEIIARAGSGITKIADLKGKTFAFGSVSSTSGHLMPRFYLREQGIDPDRDMRVAFSGAHDATAFQVQGGKVDAGALNISVWNKMIEEKKIDPSTLRVFYTTPPYFDYNWTVRGDLDPALIAKLREAFLALDPARPADKALLDLQRASRFIPTKVENYRGIEAAARSAGLLK